MSTASPTSQIHPAPSITSDPRYRAARRLIASGKSADGAIEMLATLVEEARSKYGEDSVDAAAVYYEYGNSLFRAVEKRRADNMDVMDDGGADVFSTANPSAPASAGALVAEEWTVYPLSMLPSLLEMTMIEEAGQSGWQTLYTGLEYLERFCAQQSLPSQGSSQVHSGEREV